MVFTDNRQDKIILEDKMESLVLEVVAYALKAEQVEAECEVSIIFVDNKEIRKINKEFRSIDKETDVLSFPMLEYEKNKVFKDLYLNHKFEEFDLNEGRLVLGDIALSLEKALEQSEEYGHSFGREVAYLFVHSILHLLGYDHMEEDEKIIMRKREEEILAEFELFR